MTSAEQIGGDFIYHYYRMFVYGEDELANFYHENAKIRRPDYGINEPKSAGDIAPHMLKIDLEQGSKFTVANFVVKGDENKIDVTVNANIEHEKANQTFTQTFTLEKIDEQYYITNDSFETKPSQELFPVSEQTKLVSQNKPKRDAPRKKKQEPKQKDRYAPWTPSSGQ